MSKGDGTLLAIATLAGVGLIGGAVYLKGRSSPGGGGGKGGNVLVYVTVSADGAQVPDGAQVELGGLIQYTVAGKVSFTIQAGTYPLLVNATGYGLWQQTIKITASTGTISVSLTPDGCGPHSPCSCNQVYDTTLCECSALVPSVIVVPSSNTVFPQWLVSVDCLNGSIDAEIWPNDQDGSCPFLPPGYPGNAPPAPTTVTIPITGSVQDGAGNKICNELVSLAFTGSSSLPWTSSDGLTYGVFVVSVPSATTVSDEGGDFTLELEVMIKAQGYQAFPGCINPLQQPSQGTIITQIPLVFTLVGTGISWPSSVTMQSRICDYLAN